MKLNVARLGFLVGSMMVSALCGAEPSSRAEPRLSRINETITKPQTPGDKILIEAVVFEVALRGTNEAETFGFGNSGKGFHVPAANEQAQNSKAVARYSDVGDLDVMVKELAANKHVRILQRPRILTSDGVAATLYVGDGRYAPGTNQNKSELGADESRHSMRELLGLTLAISPTIEPDRNLFMKIAQTIERYGGSTNIENVGTVPITTRHDLQTEATVGDRQTIILGGSLEQTQDKPSKGFRC